MLVDNLHAKTNGHTGGSLGLGSLRYDQPSNRIKGFHGKLLTSDTLGSFNDSIQDSLYNYPAATRLTARAVARNDLLPLLRSVYDDLTRDGVVEAVVPINPEYSIVYVGRNSPSRLAPDQVRSAQSKILSTALSATPVSYDLALSRVRGAYRLEVLNRDDLAPHADSLVRLFAQAYPKYLLQIDHEAVLDMATGSNIFFAAIKDGKICSVLVAEHGVVNIEGFGNLVLRELSEYATDREHGGNGLNIALQHMAIETLSRFDERAVIFAEGRAPWSAVIRSMVRAGLHHGGTLSQHCTLVSVRDEKAQYDGDYEDLHVFHV